MWMIKVQRKELLKFFNFLAFLERLLKSNKNQSRVAKKRGATISRINLASRLVMSSSKCAAAVVVILLMVGLQVVSITFARAIQYPADPGLAALLTATANNNRSEPDDRSVILDVCMFVNRGTHGRLIHDFDKAAGAVQLGLDYVRNNLLPDEVALRMYYVELGPECMVKSTAVGSVLKLTDEGVRCRVFLGPGITVYCIFTVSYLAGRQRRSIHKNIYIVERFRVL